MACRWVDGEGQAGSKGERQINGQMGRWVGRQTGERNNSQTDREMH